VFSISLEGLITLGVAAVFSLLLTPLTLPLANRLHAVDLPNKRKQHMRPTPRLGGVAVVVSAFISVLGASFMLERFAFAQVETVQTLALIAAGLIVFGIGAADDIYGLRAGEKFLAEIIAANVVLTVGGYMHVVALPFIGQVHIGTFGYVISLLWIVGITNAINLIDGLDGLAGGVGGMIAISIGLIAAFHGGHPFTVLIAVALGGACLGFLPYNWEPASVFMGDSGSLTLGFVLAVLTHNASLKSSAAVAILVPLLALGLPAIDTLLVMAYRFFKGPRASFVRRAARVFVADRQHLHHLLSEMARKRSTVVLTLYLFVAISCVAALATSITRNAALGISLLALEGVVVFFVRVLGQRKRHQANVMSDEEASIHEIHKASRRAPTPSDEIVA